MNEQPTSLRVGESRRNFWAGLRWGVFVSAFLVAQMSLAYAALKCAGSDGGAHAIPGAEEAIAKSYEEVTDDQLRDKSPAMAQEDSAK